MPAQSIAGEPAPPASKRRPVCTWLIIETILSIPAGYRLAARSGDATHGYGVKVNPSKETNVTFAPADRVIVIAEN